MSRTLIICGTVAFGFIIVAFVYLTSQGQDATVLLAFLTGLATSVIPSVIGAVKTHQTGRKIDSIAEEVSQVVEHTNGPIAETVQRVKNMEAQLGLNPPPGGEH